MYRVMHMKMRPWQLAVLMGVVLPSVMFFLAEKLLPRKNIPPTQPTAPTEQMQPQTGLHTPANILIPVLRSDGSTENMNLEEYLVGVVLGEMPLSFDIEALKAQAVVARTYTLRRSTVSPKHDGGAVCVNPSCCQSFCSQEQYMEKGGNALQLNKAISAVSATAGQVVTYNGALIEATYFSCSGGRTEDALAVWGAEIPYLQAVDSPGEENASHFTDSVTFSGKEFAQRLGLPLSGNPASWLGSVTYTDGGGVDTMIIGGVPFKGTQLRQKLGIRSTAFTVTAIGDSVHVVTKGFGHRVGMSQYGAEAMAVAGSDYRQILSHYYPGTTVADYNRN